MKNRILPWLGLIFFLGAIWVLHRLLAEHRFYDVLHELRAITPARITLAGLLTLFSYVVMTMYDRLALSSYLHHPLPWRNSTLASLVSYAFSNNIGLSVFTSGTLRYRFYTAWDFSAEEIGRLVVFITGTFWLGILAVGGFLFFFDPLVIPRAAHLPLHTTRPAGILFAGAVAVYLLLLVRRRRSIQFREWDISLPSFKTGLLQLLVGSTDWILAGAVLYVLLPEDAGLSFHHFLAIFLFAQTIALISHVPGGLGVFETMMLLFMPGLPVHALLGVLLAYRAVYYLLPFAGAVFILGVHELLQQRTGLLRATRKVIDWTAPLIPPVMAAATLMAGAALLFSGALPAVPSRLSLLQEVFPLELLEISHFLGSIIGAALLLVAKGLQRRVDGAWLVTIILLAVGIAASLLKGVDYEEAVLLFLLLAAMLPFRRQFYRRSSLLGEAFSTGWLASIALILALSIWLGIFAYKHVDYSNDLWWRFAFHEDAPRFLRASLGSITLLLIFTLSRLLGPPRAMPASPGPEELADADKIIATSAYSDTNLALLGDKTFLFDASRTGFIMYGVSGQSWIAMGDPVGPGDVTSELAWNYRELVEHHNGWPVFYEVGTGLLHLYLDLGLTLLKIGEEAWVPLADFSLEGSGRKNLRYIHRKLGKEGFTFEVVPREAVPELLPEMHHISNAWMEEKKSREKKFSLGFFDAAYLSRFPAALIRQHGEIIAFANIWPTTGKEELSIDLMRYLPSSASGVMDYLFVNLMLWGREQGYQRFALGMAPLSGLENRPFAPLWNRLGAVIYRHGDHFYNFEGLRAYKTKFSPEWEPRYLACPGGIILPKILLNISSLIGGGLKGVIGK